MSTKKLEQRLSQFTKNTSQNLKYLEALTAIIQAYQKKQTQIDLFSEFQQKLKQLYDNFEMNQMILSTIYEKEQQVQQSDVDTVENQELIVEKNEKLNKKLPLWIEKAEDILVLQNFIKRKIQAESVKKWPLQLDQLLELYVLFKYNIAGFKNVFKEEMLPLFD